MVGNYVAGRPENVQAQFLLSKVPQLTGFRWMWAGQYPPGTTIAGMTPGDSLAEGGAESGLTAAAIRVFTNAVYQTMKTGKWGYSVRAKMQVPTSGKVSRMGWHNAAQTHFLTFGCAFASDATKYIMNVESAVSVSTVVADTAWHDFAMTSDGTTITLWIDGVSATTQAASGLVADEGMYFMLSNTDALTCMWSELVCGFIRP